MQKRLTKKTSNVREFRLAVSFKSSFPLTRESTQRLIDRNLK